MSGFLDWLRWLGEQRVRSGPGFLAAIVLLAVMLGGCWLLAGWQIRRDRSR